MTPTTPLRPVTPDAFAALMLAAADRVADAYRCEDPALIARIVGEAVAIPVPPGGPDPWHALVGALAVQVDTDVPWRARFAWTLDIAAVTPDAPERGPSSASYASASACLGGAEWGTAPPSSTRRSA